MFWLMISLLVGYMLLLPVDFTLQLHHHGKTHTRLTLRLAGIHKTWRYEGFPGAHQAPRESRGQRILSVLRQSGRAGRFLRRHTKLIRLNALLILSTCDAARTAILTGLLRSVCMTIQPKHCRICIQPDFFHAHSTLQAKCIIRWKLGTLILTAGLLLAEALRHQQLTESEAT